MISEIKAAFDQINQDYLAVHRAKENLFWATYMATSDDHEGYAAAEQAYKSFVADPARLSLVRDLLDRLGALPATEEALGLRRGLDGWRALFECNIIDNAEAARHMHELIAMEAALFGKRRDYAMHHVNEHGRREEASLATLSTNIGSNPRSDARKSSHDALLGLEHWVLENGFIEIVGKRNALARALGYATYFDYKLAKNEAMTRAQLFAILDDFEERTRDANQRSLDRLAAMRGQEALLPFNLRYHMGGDVTRQMDAYLPFAKSVERWVKSFRRLGITYRGALVQLDLLERRGKYQNGFCHGPIPSFFDGSGHWVPAQINFTANAKPDQVGSGARAINTLFHEGGHAAHFANVTGNAPCFSQEFPPTSMAYAETQSMFCDSILDDADWLKRYALDRAGNPIPDDLIRARIQSVQPWRAFQERSLLVMPYFEVALYDMSDAERTPAAVLDLARRTEMRILGIPVGPRPLVAVPHLLNQESAAAYHGYLLANMAVYQTRAYFQRSFGHICDNPAVGPLLARHYWASGNAMTHDQTLRGLTGEGFSARYLAEECNASSEEAWERARLQIADQIKREQPSGVASLDAKIRIVHGDLLIADNSRSEEAMAADFERWVGEHYPASVPL